MHPLKRAAWYGLGTGGVIGTFFFKTDEGTAVTVNGERYRDVVSTQLAWKNWRLTTSCFSMMERPVTPHVKRLRYSTKNSVASDILTWRQGMAIKILRSYPL